MGVVARLRWPGRVQKKMTVQPPFPISHSGTVERGFGRGSKQLGVPTANLPQSVADAIAKALEPHGLQDGIYYGYCRVMTRADAQVDAMVMSVGWNPQFRNEKRSAEVHVLREFAQDFYGVELRVVVAGFLRPERVFTGLDELIAAIRNDIACGRAALAALHEAQRAELTRLLMLKRD